MAWTSRERERCRQRTRRQRLARSPLPHLRFSAVRDSALQFRPIRQRGSSRPRCSRSGRACACILASVRQAGGLNVTVPRSRSGTVDASAARSSGIRPDRERGRRRRGWLLAHASESEVRLQFVADQAGSKHTGDSRNRGKGGPPVADHNAGPSRAWRCAPLAICRAEPISPETPLAHSKRGVGRARGALSAYPRRDQKQGVRVDRADDVRADGVPRPAGGEFRDFGSPRARLALVPPRVTRRLATRVAPIVR